MNYGDTPRWQPMTPRLRPLRLLLAWTFAAASVWVAAGLIPGVALGETGSAFLVAAGVAVINAVVPPLIAALRLPWMLAVGFVAVLFADALALQIAADALPDAIRIDSFGDALLAALVMAATSIVLEVIAGTNDEDEYSLRVVRRIAKRQGGAKHQDEAGIIF